MVLRPARPLLVEAEPEVVELLVVAADVVKVKAVRAAPVVLVAIKPKARRSRAGIKLKVVAPLEEPPVEGGPRLPRVNLASPAFPATCLSNR